jgi:hypothetical protein
MLRDYRPVDPECKPVGRPMKKADKPTYAKYWNYVLDNIINGPHGMKQDAKWTIAGLRVDSLEPPDKEECTSFALGANYKSGNVMNMIKGNKGKSMCPNTVQGRLNPIEASSSSNHERKYVIWRNKDGLFNHISVRVDGYNDWWLSKLHVQMDEGSSTEGFGIVIAHSPADAFKYTSMEYYKPRFNTPEQMKGKMCNEHGCSVFGGNIDDKTCGNLGRTFEAAWR